MDEKVEQPKKKIGWPKGKKRGPRLSTPMFTSATEAPAPINVRVTLRNGADPVEFGCARRFIEGGFHVFFYPSKTDPYRETRREFAISEIVEIEITEARQTAPVAPEIRYEPDVAVLERAQRAVVAGRPQIHSVRKNAAGILGQLEQAQGSIKMDELPNLSFGDSQG